MAELIDYRKQVALKAEQTLKEFEERRTFISSQVILKVTVSPASRKSVQCQEYDRSAR